MADTAVTTTNVVKLDTNVASAHTAGQAVTTGNTAVLTPQPGQVLFTSATSVGPQFDPGHLLVEMSNGAGATTVTFEAGVVGGTPANRAVYGDLAVSLASGDRKYLSLEVSRFQQANGTVRASVSGQTVTFTVVQLDEAA